MGRNCLPGDKLSLAFPGGDLIVKRDGHAITYTHEKVELQKCPKDRAAEAAIRLTEATAHLEYSGALQTAHDALA
jgi:hypothetical protein